jgi:hypothetical protein
MRNWMIETGLAKAEELDSIEKAAKQHVKEAKSRAWKAFSDPVKKATRDLQEILKPLLSDATIKEGIQGILNELDSQLKLNPLLGEVCAQARRAKYVALRSPDANLDALNDWLNTVEGQAQQRYHTHLYSASEHSALRVPVVPADFGMNPFVKMDTRYSTPFSSIPSLPIQPFLRSEKMWVKLETSTKALQDYKINLVKTASLIRVFANGPSWARQSVWRCGDYVRWLKSNTSIT